MTILANGDLSFPTRYPAEGVDAENGDPLSWSRRCYCDRISLEARLARAGPHHRNGHPLPLFALAIEAEWRKRAAGVVPAQPKARPEGRHPFFQVHAASITETTLST